MNLVLKRFGSTPYGTFGVIHIDGEEFYTVERPWLHNQPGVSCVPLGEYSLKWQPTTTKVPSVYEGYTWYLDGEDVSPDHVSEKSRTRCALHIANKFTEVNGCIAIGKGLGYIGDCWGIVSSTVGMTDLLSLIGPGEHSLSIIAGKMG